MNEKKDGDIYKVVTVHGESFELRYGYYEEFERGVSEPIPIYPDFKHSPRYTKEGYPFVTQMQELCDDGKSQVDIDACCADCLYFGDGEDFIGICKCESKRQSALPDANEGRTVSFGG